MVHHYHEDKKETKTAKLKRAMRKYRALLQSLADKVQPAVWERSSEVATFQAQHVEAGRQLVFMPTRKCKSKKYHRNVSRPPFQNFTVKISPPQPNNMQLTCLTASIFHQEKNRTACQPGPSKSSIIKPWAPFQIQFFKKKRVVNEVATK